MRGGEHGWSNRKMPIFKRSLPRWAQLTLSSYCLGAFPLQFPSTTWTEHWALSCNRMRMSQLPPSLRYHWLQAPQAVQLAYPELCHFQYPPHWISPLKALPQWGTHLLSSLLSPHRKKQDHSLSSSLGDHHDKRTSVDSKRSRLGVNTALYGATTIGTGGWT